MAAEAEQGFTTSLEALLDRWNAGDESAVEQIIEYSQERLRNMARRMLAAKPHVRRWNETDDVLQNALIRLHRALMSVKPDSKRAFLGLAATQIRRELIDMARSLYGQEGHARHHKSDPGNLAQDNEPPPLYEEADDATDPARNTLSGDSIRSDEMMAFHEAVGSLPDDLQKVFDQIFYLGMKQREVARKLEISERTVKRRWRDARLSLQRVLESTETQSR